MYTLKRISPTSACTLLGMNGGCPESPDMRRLVYTEKDNAETPVTRICVCDRDTLENHRVLFEVECLNHNSASTSWIDNSHIVFRDTRDGLSCFHILNVDTGRELYAPIFAKESHCAENGIYPFSLSREFVGKNPTYPEIDECGIYTLNVKTGEIKLVATEQRIADMIREHGCVPRENSAAVSHVQLNPSATSVMMRIGVDECPVFGALGCIDLDTGATHFIKDKPVHQLWYDDDTYMATRQFANGRQIEMETAYIARFSKDGEEIEVLGGIGNHIDGSPDRAYFTGDRCYPGYAPNVYVYRRGDKTPICEIPIESAQEMIWKKQVHPNPTFSRDGKRVYFNSPRTDGTTACFAELDFVE